MKSRILVILAAATAIAAVGAGVTGATAVAGSVAPAAACPAGEICVWSGTSYTGQMALLNPEYPWNDCVSAASLGLPSIRSAKRNGVQCQWQASLHADGACGASTEPAFVQINTPTISPAALSVGQFLIPC